MDRQDGTASDTRQIDQSTQPFPGFEALNARPSYVAADSTFSSTPSEPGYLPQRPAEAPRHLRQQGSYSSSTLPIAAGAATPGSVTPILPGSDGSGQSFAMGDYQSRQVAAGQSPYYHDSPYQNSSLNFAPQVGEADINPQNIADDGDDGFMPDPKRKSVLGMRGVSSNEAGASGAVGGAAAGGVLRALSTLGGRKQKAQVSGAAYDPVANSGNAEQGGAEKSEWLSRQTKGNNKMRWVVGLTIGAVVLLAVIGGIVGGVLGSRAAAKSGNDGGPLGNASGDVLNNAEDDLAANGIIDKNSGEIKKLMNNPDLHKVFPAMDYTPWGTQYPDCLTYPPSQNNITRNMAVLSQLTNTVRLYGTDCNQTEMVVESIRRLELDSMKVWLGVWIETNTTTNDRQLEQMYKILEDISDHSVFQGVIVGNEALYRAGNDKASSEQNLINILSEVKSNFTSLGYDHLPVATSDLGDNWTPQLVQVSDAVMANIHPFFAGVRVEEAAGWTWSFWQQKDIPLTQGTDKPQIISEAGWPSGGGNNCGSETAECAPGTGSVAGIDEMNTFMNDFVCQGLENGTDYFW